MPRKNTNKQYCVEMNPYINAPPDLQYICILQMNTASQQFLCWTTRGHQQSHEERKEGEKAAGSCKQQHRERDIKTQNKKMLLM